MVISESFVDKILWYAGKNYRCEGAAQCRRLMGSVGGGDYQPFLENTAGMVRIKM